MSKKQESKEWIHWKCKVKKKSALKKVVWRGNFLHVFLFRGMISWLFCIYWHLNQLIDCFSFHSVLLWMILWEKMFVYSVYPFFKSDNLFCVYHLIYWYLFISIIFSGSMHKELFTPCMSRCLIKIQKFSYSTHYLHFDGSKWFSFAVYYIAFFQEAAGTCPLIQVS